MTFENNIESSLLDPAFDTSSVTFPPGKKLREIEKDRYFRNSKAKEL